MLSFRDRAWEAIAGLGVLTQEEYGALFDERRFVERLDGVFARLEKLEVDEPVRDGGSP